MQLHSLWQESLCDFADITWRRTSALKIGLPAAQLLLATRQRVAKILLSFSVKHYSNASLVQREVAFSQENDAGIVLSLLSPNLQSLSRLRRQLPLHKGAFHIIHRALTLCLLPLIGHSLFRTTRSVRRHIAWFSVTKGAESFRFGRRDLGMIGVQKYVECREHRLKNTHKN